MVKLNSLLKKIEVFEKLALYGDRKEFLKKISEPVQTSTPAFSQDLPPEAQWSIDPNTNVPTFPDPMKFPKIPSYSEQDLKDIEKNVGPKAVKDTYPPAKPETNTLDNAKFFSDKLTRMNPQYDFKSMVKILNDVKTRLLPSLKPQDAAQIKQQLDAQEKRVDEFRKTLNPAANPILNKNDNPYK